MTQEPVHRTQLDRLENKLDSFIDLVARMEERQAAQAAKLSSHDDHIYEHGKRLREVELTHAVSAASSRQTESKITGRWAAIGATSLVILGGIGAFVGNLIARMITSGGGG